MEQGISALCIYTQHGYSFLLLLFSCFSRYWRAYIARSHGKLYYVWSQEPGEVMHQNVGWCYRSSSLWGIFAIVELQGCEQLTCGKKHEVLMRLQVTSFPGKWMQVCKGCSFTCEVAEWSNPTLTTAGNKVCCSALQDLQWQIAAVTQKTT